MEWLLLLAVAALLAFRQREKRPAADLLTDARGLIDNLRSELTDIRERHGSDVNYYRQELVRLRGVVQERTRQIKERDSEFVSSLLEQAHEHLRNPEGFNTAGRLLQLSVIRDPTYAPALSWLSYWHLLRANTDHSTDQEFNSTHALHYAAKAVEYAPGDAMAHATKGYVIGYFRKDFNTAFTELDLALRIDPELPRGWIWSSATHSYLAQGRPAVEKAEKALLLVKDDPFLHSYPGIASIAYLVNQQYDRSIEMATRCLQGSQGYASAYKVLILALVLSGREREAKTAVDRLMKLDPHFTVLQFRNRSPIGATRLMESYCEALSRAGIP